MIRHIHIIGASGAGTTTLANALSARIGYRHIDTDHHYWLPTAIPYTEKRSIEDRKAVLRQDLDAESTWILSGSLCGWGDCFIPDFDLVVFLSLPKEVRMGRLAERERQRAGKAIEPGGDAYTRYCDFMAWAEQYDEAGLETRSRALHELWLSKLPCEVLWIEGDKSVEERLEILLTYLMRRKTDALHADCQSNPEFRNGEATER